MTGDIKDTVTRRYPAGAKSKLKTPDYSELGPPAFAKELLPRVKELLSVNKKRRKIINSLKENGVIGDETKFDKENVLIGVRMPNWIKKRYPNDFTDLFFLFTSEDRNVEVFLGSTTPSPAYRYKEWYDFYVRIGMVGLIKQRGSYLLEDGTYQFSKASGEKNKFKIEGLNTELLVQDGGVKLKRYGIDSESISAAINAKPDVGLEPAETPQIYIAPALPYPQEAKALDATTSGDQVIRRSQDFGKVLKAGSGGIKYILKTLPEEFAREKEGEEKE